MMNDDEKCSYKSINYESCSTLWISVCNLWCADALQPIGTSAHPSIYYATRLHQTHVWLSRHHLAENMTATYRDCILASPSLTSNHWILNQTAIGSVLLPLRVLVPVSPRHSDKASNSKTSWSMRDLATLVVISFPQWWAPILFTNCHNQNLQIAMHDACMANVNTRCKVFGAVKLVPNKPEILCKP